jgi:DNA-binding response OmpR family regulator
VPIQSQQSARIAIVEDSPLQAELLKRVLSEKGYAVEVARDGAEGLELVRRIKPDLVVSDVVMPEMDGYDLCRAIKRDRALSGIPVLLLTSLDDPEDIIRGLDSQADNYLTKPYEEERLLARVEQLLTNQELRRGPRSGKGVEIFYARRRRNINVDNRQILDLLMSTFEDAVHQNGRLKERTEELEAARRQLAEKGKAIEMTGVELESLNLPLGDIVDSGAKLLQQARERGDSEFVAEMEVLQRTVRGLRDRIDELQRQLGGGAS